MSTERHDHAALVRGWLHEPVDLSPVDVGRIERRMDQAPQRRSWLPHIDTWRFQTMFSAIKYVVAGAIVALFGGFLLGGVLQTPSEDAAPAVGGKGSTAPNLTAASVATSAPTAEATPAAPEGSPVAPEPTPAVAGNRIVVGPNGNGDFRTITEAVAAAVDGDTIVVRPGTYRESITISKDITLLGKDRDRVVIKFATGCRRSGGGDSQTCPEGTAMYENTTKGPQPYALLIDDSTAEIRDLTIQGSFDGGFGLIVRGGAPVISGITYGKKAQGGALYVHDGSSALISDATLGAAVVRVEEQSPATVEDSTFQFIVVNTSNTSRRGGPATIRNNRTTGIWINGSALVEGNRLVGKKSIPEREWGSGIDVEAGDGWIIRDNVVQGFSRATAIDVTSGATGTVSGNTVKDNMLGIVVGSGDSVIEDNTVTGGDAGILTLGGSPSVIANDVSGMSGRGLALSGDPIVRGNRSCGNGEDLWVNPAGAAVVHDDNEICDAAPPQ